MENGSIPTDLISSKQVLAEYKISRVTLTRFFTQKQLRRFRIAGDRLVYVSRADMDALRTPREV